MKERGAASAIQKTAVILNGVSLWAQAGAKRSEGSLTETRAEAVGENARDYPAASARGTVSGSSLRHCPKASDDCVQNDGRFWSAALRALGEEGDDLLREFRADAFGRRDLFDARPP